MTWDSPWFWKLPNDNNSTFDDHHVEHVDYIDDEDNEMKESQIKEQSAKN